MRVSDAERDQVAEVLREAAAEGRITLDELDERLDAAYAARTYDDLQPLTEDLPSGPGAPTGPLPPVVDNRPPEFRDGGGALVIRSPGTTVSRKGHWQVPPRIEVDNPYGSTRLDFREAYIPTTLVEVHLNASWGSAALILPEGATAEVDVDTAWFGSLRVDVDSVRRTSGTHFVITGQCHGGGLSVRYKRPFSWANLGGLGS
ncbi:MULTISPECIES: DUF1707 domain-containing protein [unclassified Nocardiopsis]|uniref:DUF1707 SHOCT-like domain-containing protein n=1 Tax=unclassified Nocardiopsis TaxID=2649073 RepID=UPI00135C9D5C|nr:MULTISPECIES: DUF1707 domain-containing protein [unclassified Nocardiopsis]